MSSNDDKYPEPEGWGNDGFWRDPSIDSDYETGLTSPVRPTSDAPRADPGYSYWSDDRGWESSPGGAGAGAGSGGAGRRPGDATSIDATRASYPPAGQPGGAGGDWPPGGDRTAFYGASGGPTAVYGGGPGGPFGPGGPGGPGGRGPGGPAGGGPGRRGGPRVKRKGDWWRHWTWKKSLAVVGSAFVVFILALIGSYYYLYSSATIPAALANALEQSSTVYYSNGTTVLGTITSEDRQNLTLSQIPKTMQDAVIAAEDRSFWTEGGISPTGILRAAYDDLTSSGSLSGGSTITQEFVRNYYEGVGTQQTLSRKIKEVFIAQKLAASKSKDWILQNYLNLIYLGDGAYGVEAASQTYFGKPLAKLTVGQDAMIAAVIQQPSTYYLPQYRSDLIARWHYVLNGMVAIGDLTQAQASALAFPKLLTDSPSYHPPGLTQGCAATSGQPWAAYLMTEVCGELQADKVSIGELEDDGMKVVTTFSEPMEAEMYKAVNENLSQIKYTPGATVSSLPAWALVGAELQDPKNGDILAEYPGRGENMSYKKCLAYDCDQNTTLTREQVGSSFKPYVLSTAVQEGMNVSDSIMNSSEYLCVAPDSSPQAVPVTYSQPISASVYYEPGNNTGCKNPGAYKVENDGGEAIGTPVGPKGDGLWKTTVQNALAQSSNTAFTDLTHRAGTSSVIQMAQSFGVNIAAYPNGSGLTGDVHQVAAVALGESSLTVNEQAQMIATIDDNGVFHAGHVVKYWQLPNGPEQTPSVESRVVLTPAQDSQVQYAMEATTVDGTAVDAAVGLGGRPIIGKTGTTTGEHSGFFVGAIPQYAMVVGMFASEQNTANANDSLAALGGGGFGGYWPAKIWNTFFQAEFASLPAENFQSPQFSGNLWNMIGNIPKAKNKKKPTTHKCNPQQGGGGNGNGHGHGHGHGNQPQMPQLAVGCGTTSPTPTPTPTPTNSATGNPTGSPTGQPTTTGTPTPTTSLTPTPTATGTATPTATATATRTGHPFGGNTAATAQGGVKAGLAVGGVLVTVLPGSLLWTSACRRRRRRRAQAASAPDARTER